MANVFKLKQSNTASAVPLSGDLEVGELAFNSVDGKLYTKLNNGNVVEIARELPTPAADGTYNNPTSITIENGIITAIS